MWNSSIYNNDLRESSLQVSEIDQTPIYIYIYIYIYSSDQANDSVDIVLQLSSEYIRYEGNYSYAGVTGTVSFVCSKLWSDV